MQEQDHVKQSLNGSPNLYDEGAACHGFCNPHTNGEILLNALAFQHGLGKSETDLPP
jgi:hypothetical protein